jgi:hypothetical protein
VLKSKLPHKVPCELSDWIRCIGRALVQEAFLSRMQSDGLANPQVWSNARTGHEHFAKLRPSLVPTPSARALM